MPPMDKTLDTPPPGEPTSETPPNEVPNEALKADAVPEAAPASADAAVDPPPELPPMSDYARFVSGFWAGPTRRQAWTLTAAIGVIMAVTLGINLAQNYWNRWFFDALEKKDAARLLQVLFWLPFIIAGGAAFAVLMIRCRQALQIRWREYVASRVIALWLGNQRYYRLTLTDRHVQNPEYRIVEDIRLSTEPVVELAVGLVWSCASALTFVGVLITVGGSITFGGTTIPAYMALTCIAYALLVCGVTIFVGRPLTGHVAAKNEAEAQLQYELTRVRENSESIALMHGDAREKRQATARLAAVVKSALVVSQYHGHLTWVQNGNAFLAPIVPALLAAPKYLSGELSLGSVMQLIAAFAAVLGALNWIADNFVRLAEIKASLDRVHQLRSALVTLDDEDDEITSLPSIAVGAGSSGGDIELQNVTLKKSDGQALISRVSLRVKAGEKVLIEGRSGSGKSTLLRALAGLWPWGAGQIRLPANAKIAFVPQRPYIPIGKLRDALYYPDSDAPRSHETTEAVLKKVGLEHLIERLDLAETWDRILSGGERQRLAMGRLLIQKPDIIVLDEATSALDDEGQHQLFTVLTTELPEATVLNVAHRQGLEKFHDRKIVIGGNKRNPVVQMKTLAARAGRSLSFWRRSRPAETSEAAPSLPTQTVGTPDSSDLGAKDGKGRTVSMERV